jgi:alanyl-tRNA synthetase
MGFERIVRVLQGKDSNYDTDVFTPIFAAIKQATGARDYTPGGHDDALKDPINIAYRVIADHIRTLTFALSDGAHCGNEGRNYVLRSILRRAVRYGKQTLGVEEPFFYKLVAAVVENFGEVFPEIKKKQGEVEAELKEEEESFRRTLDRGITLFDQVATRVAGDAKRPVFPGGDAFKLHDTYGFPIGLTQVMAEERGMSVDLEGFEREMERAREISRGGEGSADVKATLTEFVQQNEIEPTQFVGYTQTESPVTVTHIVAVSDNEHAIVLDQTPFYAEQGGQVGDRGEITTGAVDFEVHDTQKIGDVYFHLGQFHKGIFDEGTQASARIKTDRRALIQSNHTITHIMNRALRDHVSPDAMQKGSLVDDEKTRFDFSHNAALTPEQLELVEKLVNDDIAKDLKVYDAEAPQEEALKIKGLRAVFGEKYPPKVRVVSVGVPVADLLANPGNSEWANYSIEFCGGTHLEKTGDAEGFVVVSQDAVSKGVRRVTALTGAAAHKASAIGQSLLSRIESLHDAPADRLETAIADVTTAMGEATLPLLMKTKIQAGLADLTERVKDYKKAQGGKLEEQVIEEARAVAEATDEDALLVVAQIPGADAKTLRTAMDVIRKKRPSAAMLLAADAGEGKVALLTAVPPELIAKGLKAGDWVKHTAPIVGGGGGGRPDMAQAGGKDPAKIEEALQAARQFAQDKL